ncbi:MAG: hypothetical protein QM655_04915 [Nocardioidaceae bacterium]
MYDLYPDWGPAQHREPVDTLTAEPAPDQLRRLLQDAFDPREATGERPDDN